MTAAFPPWIRRGVALVDGYGETPETNLAAFPLDVGSPKQRRRSSISQDVLACKLWLSSDEWEDFKTFFRVTLKDCTQQFTWTHPRTKVAATFQFEGSAPKITGKRALLFEIQFSIRLISGGVPGPAFKFNRPNNSQYLGVP